MRSALAGRSRSATRAGEANVPDAIRREDHAAGMPSTLGNLAAFTE